MPDDLSGPNRSFVGEIPTRESVSSPRDIGAFPTRNPAVADTLDRVTASRQFFHASAIASAAAIHYHLFSPEIHAHHPPVARSGGPGVRRGFFLSALRFFPSSTVQSLEPLQPARSRARVLRVRGTQRGFAPRRGFSPGRGLPVF